MNVPVAHDVYIALGSNMGDRAGYLEAARKKIAESGIRLTAVSGIYETAPVGYTEQPAFLNQVCRACTALEPQSLLETLQRIETALARRRIVHWGPRTIDLDLLLYDDLHMQTETLTLPHPRMFERAFVLVPLRDVWPAAEIAGKPPAEWIASCADKNGVRPYAPPSKK
ncbi:2-amino-4-hydroxy-6-hydroxymethyldihydropteridine pyrophosphokinase [Ethanoligenens harbinense YUAN-3]|uniref:2-amino-4-hydroxy-6-hydroxymethyldihydropteridine diphosphokinase n=1 Tax=Ethanoligenens harbinense (strain DSM 18485 / JCM 12961 / CGMCC 1.5033 / YUAN-3) TaxID=663278 RepID=E6U3M2_ETHHY|nr:2-amino-4-hydroxy-6-hydroxymethyldihydropteridine diphosphokinase [Ethanoligenens harbinense]ADU27622.1 2-amino-4-hydroxy-6-hydroxymethyldihydropteridine pyrophosphokinase [Ethanoligenens harbinense YUAN-3]